MRESTIEINCSNWAKANGWLGFKFSSPQQRGVCDRLYIKNGLTVYVEFKTPGKHPTKYQLHIMNKMREQGAIVHVIDNMADFINVMS